MPYERADFRLSAVAGAWYVVFTLFLVPIDRATLASPLALAQSILIRLVIVVAFMAVSRLYIGTQDVVFDSIVPMPPRPVAEAAPDPEEPPYTRRPAVRHHRLTALLIALCFAHHLSSHWDQLIPARFSVNAAYAWAWSLFVSIIFGAIMRSFFFYSDAETGRPRLTVKTNPLIFFTVLVLVIDLIRHYHTLLHPPSALYLVLACISHALGDLCLGTSLALAFRVCEASIKNIRRPKLLSFLTFSAALFGFVAYFDRKDLLADQPGAFTIARFLADLVFSLLIALFLNGFLTRSMTPAQIPSILPHPEGPATGDVNPAARSGV
jgi:hypothetical protein